MEDVRHHHHEDDRIGGTPPTTTTDSRTAAMMASSSYDLLDVTDRHGILSPQTQTRDGVGFASSQNLEEIMPYLNQSLADLGYPSPLELMLPNAGDLARTCNVLFLMLRDRQNDVTARERAGEERRRLHSELARVETHFERMKAERDAKEQELANAMAKHASSSESSRKKLEEACAERDALRTQLAQAGQRRAQAENESRKREKEFEKLKTKLSALVNDKRREVVCASIQIGKQTVNGGVKERIGTGTGRTGVGGRRGGVLR